LSRTSDGNAQRGPTVSLFDLKLQSGERIWAASLHCQQTYAHLYEGQPDHESNDGYLSHFRERVKRIFHGPYPVHIVDPVRLPDPLGRSPFGSVIEYLPKYWFAAECYGGGMQTCLAIVWFQAEPFPIPSDEARAELEAIDWAKWAEEFSP
jgi:hypothetical protein